MWDLDISILAGFGFGGKLNISFRAFQVGNYLQSLKRNVNNIKDL